MLIETIRVALQAEGIDALIEEAASSALPIIPATIHVADQHFARAEAIVAQALLLRD